MFMVLIIIFNIVFYVSAETLKNDNLVALVQIIRHGERSPTVSYSNDPHKSYWKDAGQLTNEGRRELHSLGQFTRDRYSDWIPTRYTKDFFYIEATKSERTYMSALSYVYGLFPAIDEQKWLPTSDWQPIPVYTSNKHLFWFEYSLCPTYENIYNNIKEFKIFNEKNLLVYNYLSKYTGVNITNFYDAWRIWDCLMVEERTGLDLPEWTKSVYPNPISSVAAMHLKAVSYTNQLKKFYTGFPLNTWLEFFHEKAFNNSKSPTFQAFTVHDNQMASILNSLGAFDEPFILQFACTVWLELRSKNNTHYINAWFKNGEDLHPIRINGCEFDCPLGKVKTLLEEYLVDEKTWIQECHSYKSEL